MNRPVVFSPASSQRRGCTRTGLSLALVVCLASSGRALTAQVATPTAPNPQRTPSTFAWPRLVDVQYRPLAGEKLTGVVQPAQRGSSRDSLKNGAVIGAIAGAVGLGAFGALICHLYQEEGGASCGAETLRVAAIGAAIGTAAGVTVDAALTRHAGVAVRIGVKF
jgi:hypothetical protein